MLPDRSAHDIGNALRAVPCGGLLSGDCAMPGQRGEKMFPPLSRTFPRYTSPKRRDQAGYCSMLP